ncbi:hypothetical protein D3C71_1631670 [compost metagenome]
MGNATKADVVALANSWLYNNANAGISWGNNNYPAGSLAGWFGGSTGGTGVGMSTGSFSDGNANAASVAAALRAFANTFARIRRVRIVIYYANNSGEDFVNAYNTVQYDGTAIAHTAYSVGDVGGQAALPGLGANQNLSYGNLNQACANLWTSYYNNARNTTLTLTNTICHSSCHDNCHCARGRR